MQLSTHGPDPSGPPQNRVLFVDDDPMVRNAVGRCLDRAAVPCQLAASGREALAAIAADPSGFSVVLADYQMPELDGVAVLREVAVASPWTTRILVSGQLSLHDAVDAMNSGAIFQIVTKPVVADELVAVVKKGQDRANLAHRNAQLLLELREKNARLAELNGHLDQLLADRTSALLGVLAGAIDLRTDRASGRARRLAAYARRLATAMGLPPAERLAAEQGALLQAVGLLSASDALLRPSAPLSEAQRAQLDQQCVRGAEILDEVEFLRSAAEVVRHQQERFDGSGGPRGVVGQQIPVGARILHLVSVLDNLTRPDADAPARGWAWAREEIRRQAGTALDPAVVAAFERIDDEQWAAIQRGVHAAR